MTRLSFFLSFVFLGLCVVFLQGNVHAHKIDGEHITQWLVLSPFFSVNDADSPHSDDVWFDINVRPQAGDTLSTTTGASLTWEAYRTQTGTVDLFDLVGEREGTTAYISCILESHMAGVAQIHITGNNGVVVWMNGREVHRNLGSFRDVFDTRLRAGENYCLVKILDKHRNWGVTMQVLPPSHAVLSGEITDEAGQPIWNAEVHVEQKDSEVARTWTDASGYYHLKIYPVAGRYDLSASHDDRGDWQLGVLLRKGERRTISLTLKPEISIEGTLLMRDGKTPHVAVPVQVIRVHKGGRGRGGEEGSEQGAESFNLQSEVVATTLSNEMGKYQFVNLKRGVYQTRCQTPRGYVYYENGREKKRSVLLVEPGKTLPNVDFQFAPFKKGTWKTYNTHNGLINKRVSAIHRDADGTMWFGTDGGVARWDSREFINFTSRDGLPNSTMFAIYGDWNDTLWFGAGDYSQNFGGGVSQYDGESFLTLEGLTNVWAIHQGSDGAMWFGTRTGVSRWDGQEFATLTTEDGLCDNWVYSIHEDLNGVMWFGTKAGVSRYDGKRFVDFNLEDGLAQGNLVSTIIRDPNGRMWIGKWGGGVLRYDGAELLSLTTQDGLVDDTITDIYNHPDYTMWFATLEGGISRYDGKGFVNFTTQDGLASNEVAAIYPGVDGAIWFATRSGVSRYDGITFMNLDQTDGLGNNRVFAIYQDRDGFMWFGTMGSGVFRYDGQISSLTENDGLASNTVGAIYQDRDGAMWFGTSRGISRYDGKELFRLTAQDGSVHGFVRTIYQDSDGAMWFGTSRGISRYDGEEFSRLTTQDGLVHDSVRVIYQDSDGVMWFGTENGVLRYDGTRFSRFTTKNGLRDNHVHTIHQDSDGAMWVATEAGVSRYDPSESRGDNKQAFDDLVTQDSAFHAAHQTTDGTMWFAKSSGTGGVSGYDGTAWTSLDREDGLVGDEVYAVYEDSDKCLWFGTENGVTRYCGSSTPPSVRIKSVQTDQRKYTENLLNGFSRQSIEPVISGTRVTIAYSVDHKQSEMPAMRAFFTFPPTQSTESHGRLTNTLEPPAISARSKNEFPPKQERRITAFNQSCHYHIAIGMPYS